MTKGPFSAKGARASLVVSLSMTMFGFWGAVGSAYQLTARPTAPEVDSADVPPEVGEAVGALVEEVYASHLDEAAAVANLLASSLLIIGSFLLSARRASALWWVRQALVANVLYTVGIGVVELIRLREFGERFLRLALSSNDPLPEGVTEGDVVGVMMWVLGALLIGRAVLLIAFYLGLLKLAGREDVQAFVAPDAA